MSKDDIEICVVEKEENPIEVELVLKPKEKKKDVDLRLSEFMWRCPICGSDMMDDKLWCEMCYFDRRKAYYLGEHNGKDIWDDGTFRYEIRKGVMVSKTESTRLKQQKTIYSKTCM